jgi:regulator of sigma E protease
MLEILLYFGSFILVIVTLVFVHEFGHYLAARLCGVKVETFSIGMGKVICSYVDAVGTRWCLSYIPLGGYVQMLGDSNASSSPDFGKLDSMSPDHKKQSFYYKAPWQKLLIAFAGPLSNYIFAIILFASLACFSGITEISTIVSKVIEQSPAEHAGLVAGDQILEISGSQIKNFSELQDFMILHNSSEVFEVTILRDKEVFVLPIQPRLREVIDALGAKRLVPFVGVVAGDYNIRKYDYFESIIYGVNEAYRLSVMTLKALYQMITGSRSVREMGGPISIAEYSGKTLQLGFVPIIWFLALLSVNLGLMNLLPIPLLDGGHILFNIIEIITGKAIKKRIQEYGLKLGLVILGSLMIFTTINDLVRVIWGK